MADPLIIQIKGDNAPWRQAISQTQQGAKTTADVQVREATRAAKEIAKQAKAAADFQWKESLRAARESAKAFDQIGKEANKSRLASEKAAKSAADAFARESRRTEKDAQRQSATQIMELKRWERSNVISLGTVQAAGIKYQNRLQEDARKTANEQTRAAAKAARAYKETFSVGGFAAGQFKDVLGSVAGQLTLINIGQSAISGGMAEYERYWQRVNDRVREGVNLMHEYVAASPELAALNNRPGANAAQAKATLGLRRQTLQTLPEAVQFEQGMMNLGQTERGTKIAEPEWQKLLVGAGSLQPALGVDPRTLGEFAGMMPSLTGKAQTTADEAMSGIGKGYNLIQAGGSDFGSGLRQFMAQSIYTKQGVYKDFADQLMTQSIFSKEKPLQAGEMTEQFIRATAGSTGKLRGAKVDGEHEKIAEYYKRIGVNNQMDPNQIGLKIAADFKTQQGIEAQAGRTFNPLDYLVHRGFGNQEDRTAIMTFANAANNGMLGQFEAIKNAPSSAEGLNQMVAAFQGGDANATERGANLAEEQKTLGRGNAIGRDLARTAWAQYAAREKINSTFEEVSGEKGFWQIPYGGSGMLTQAVAEMASGRLQRAGMSPANAGNIAEQFWNPWDPEGSQNAVARMAAATAGANGNSAQPVGPNSAAIGADRNLDVLIRIQQGIDALVKQAGRPGIPPPVGARGPAPPDMRP
jgi:hypothetical protein